MPRPMNTASIEQETGRSWPAWCEALDQRGARALSHPQIVEQVHAEGVESGWWAQTITVAYEQAIGRRIPGQTSTGSFSAAVSRTLPGEPAAVLARWCAVVDGMATFDGVAPRTAPTTAETPKRLYWRAKFADGSSVAVSFERKPGGKTMVAVGHDNLADAAEVLARKQYWAGLVERLTERTGG